MTTLNEEDYKQAIKGKMFVAITMISGHMYFGYVIPGFDVDYGFIKVINKKGEELFVNKLQILSYKKYEESN